MCILCQNGILMNLATECAEILREEYLKCHQNGGIMHRHGIYKMELICDQSRAKGQCSHELVLEILQIFMHLV